MFCGEVEWAPNEARGEVLAAEGEVGPYDAGGTPRGLAGMGILTCSARV